MELLFFKIKFQTLFHNIAYLIMNKLIKISLLKLFLGKKKKKKIFFFFFNFFENFINI